MALNMALTTVIGQCIGGKRIDRVKAYLKCSIIYGGIGLTVLSIIVVIFQSNYQFFLLIAKELLKLFQLICNCRIRLCT